MKFLKNKILRVVIYFLLSGYAVFCGLPFYWALLQSLKTVRQAFSRKPLFFFSPTGKSYSELWLDSSPATLGWLGLLLLGVLATVALIWLLTRRRLAAKLASLLVVLATLALIPLIVDVAEFYRYFTNSMIITAGVVLLSMSIGSLSGYALARYRGLAGIVILIVALGFRALPRTAFALPFYSIGQATGLHDTYLLLILVLTAANQPFTIWMMRAFFLDVPKEIEEAARIDGLGPLATFMRVVLPVVIPGLISTGLFSMLLAYQEFLLARVLTQSKWTLPVAIVQFTGGEAPGHVTLAAAAAVSATVPIIIIIIVFQRYLIRGLTGGAVKG